MDISIRGIILIVIALIALIVNYSSPHLSKKFNVSELAIKIPAFIVVLVCITLLMIFGK